jgi:hypothetical protein
MPAFLLEPLELAFRELLGDFASSILLMTGMQTMTNTDVDNLAGMFFTLDSPDGSYGTGQVIRRAAEGVYFVRFDGNEVTLPLELVTVGEMLETTEEEYKLWRFFDTAEEREVWMEWLDAPSKPRVLSLVRTPPTPTSE